MINPCESSTAAKYLSRGFKRLAESNILISPQYKNEAGHIVTDIVKLNENGSIAKEMQQGFNPVFNRSYVREVNFNNATEKIRTYGSKGDYVDFYSRHLGSGLPARNSVMLNSKTGAVEQITKEHGLNKTVYDFNSERVYKTGADGITHDSWSGERPKSFDMQGVASKYWLI